MSVVLFDLEGTLVKSLEINDRTVLDFRAKTKKKLIELGIPETELELTRTSTLMRNKAVDYVERKFSQTEAWKFHLEMDKFQIGFEFFWAGHTEIFQDTILALEKLKNIGCRICLVTNTSREAAKRILTSYDLQPFFEVIVTREDVKRLKPDPQGIQLVLEKLKVKEFFFVGDLIYDSQAATRAGGISIIVNRTGQKKLDFHADYVVKSLVEIPEIILARAIKEG